MAAVDTHVHTMSSPDADIPASELCRMAASAGISAIGFVAHLDMHPEDYCHGGFSEKGYLQELSAADSSSGGRIEVLRGVEIGEPHIYMDQASRLFRRSEYDFVTGALHWLESDLILDEEPFLRGVPSTLIRRYYEETLEIVRFAEINVLAHMGIFRRGLARAGIPWNFDETALYPGLLKKILGVMMERNIALELNTSGLRRPENITYPCAPVLSLYRKLGGNMLTLGSDTHKKEHAFFGIKQGAALAAELGFQNSGFFRKGVYTSCPLLCHRTIS